MEKSATLESGEGRNSVELVKSVSDKQLDLLRPSARYYSVSKGQRGDAEDRDKGKYTLIRDVEDLQTGFYEPWKQPLAEVQGDGVFCCVANNHSSKTLLVASVMLAPYELYLL
ncbi:uncharacterized protein LOC107762904 [Nicotiana tabacum]|uniref:Uncharacterized protein LOC107762904 n=1 Tax=Nicotiana tabacum TaxID=4097 RepID=A0AC58S3R0_TOBAC